MTTAMTAQQRLVLTVAVLGSFVAILDGTVVNVALPAIARELRDAWEGFVDGRTLDKSEDEGTPPIRPMQLAAGLVAFPVVSSSPSAGAVEPDLALSVTSGAARTIIEVTSPSCVDEPDGSMWRFLAARLVSGAPGSEVLAAAGSNGEGEAIRLAVPDWIDPADPAQVVAQCLELDPNDESEDGVDMVAVWNGVAEDCGGRITITGTRRPTRGADAPDPALSFRLEKAPGWR